MGTEIHVAPEERADMEERKSTKFEAQKTEGGMKRDRVSA
jgi:hypothetical protein